MLSRWGSRDDHSPEGVIPHMGRQGKAQASRASWPKNKIWLQAGAWMALPRSAGMVDGPVAGVKWARGCSELAAGEASGTWFRGERGACPVVGWLLAWPRHAAQHGGARFFWLLNGRLLLNCLLLLRSSGFCLPSLTHLLDSLFVRLFPGFSLLLCFLCSWVPVDDLSPQGFILHIAEERARRHALKQESFALAPSTGCTPAEFFTASAVQSTTCSTLFPTCSPPFAAGAARYHTTTHHGVGTKPLNAPAGPELGAEATTAHVHESIGSYCRCTSIDSRELPLTGQVSQDSVLIAVGTSLAFSSAIFLIFLLLRPFNTIVYAPRLRHTDEKHRPPPMGKSLFAWYRPVFKTNEDEYVEKIGLDATLFLRFARMCRNLFVVLAIVGCAIVIPVNVIKSVEFQKNFDGANAKAAIFLMTPRDLFGDIFWAFVALAYIFDIIVCAFLWWTYRAVHRLRRKYLESPEYQNSLHSRSLMITDINRSLRSDQGILEVADSLRTTPEVPRASIGRNVKDIPDLIEAHEEAVMDLEAVLAKYLKNPAQLPAVRPLCTPSKKDPEFTDKKQKVDAIDYLTARIQRLEAQIKEVRETVDKRDAMPYGFASYESVESAHSVAFAARSKHPKGTTVRLAPKPKDIIWKNLSLDPKTRRWRRIVNNFWITLLTLLYFIPNALIAVFLSKLTNLGFVWDTFQVELNRHPRFWAVVQGILAPALTSLFYYFLPIIFRRLSIKAGDQTKTSRERHVTSQLYSFFVFNNLFVFSLFSAVFGMVVITVKLAKDEKRPFMEIIQRLELSSTIMKTLCEVSPFWVTWLVQRNLGAVIDLSQAVNLAWGSFSRKFLNPTPRELIKRTAPPPFDYASYYNYFLFYSTVALCFAPLQPITLLVVAFYFSLDSWMKKYLLMYVFCTKNESGGAFWRVLFNRMLVGTFLANCIIALLVIARGNVSRWMMLGAMAPLPLGLLAFKFYCKNQFDHSLKYLTKGESAKGVEAPTPIDKESRRRDRVAVRFG